MLILGYNDSSVGCGLCGVSSRSMLTRNNMRHVNLSGTFVGIGLPGNRGGRVVRSVPSRGRNIGFIFGYLLSPRVNTVGSLGRVSTMNRHMIRNNSGFGRDIVISRDMRSNVRRLYSLTPIRGTNRLGNVHTMSSLVPNAPRIYMFSGTFRDAVPSCTCLCTVPCRLCRGCRMHHCNFRKASRHCISGHIYRVLNLSRGGSGVVAYRVNGNNSMTTMLGNGMLSASVNLAPLTNLVVNSHYNSVSTSTIACLVSGLGVGPRRVTSFLGGGDNILNVANVSSSVHSVRGTTGRNGRGTRLTLHVCRCHVGGCVNTCATTVNNISTVMFATNINRGRASLHRRTYGGLRCLNVGVGGRIGSGIHNRRTVVSATSDGIGMMMIPASRRVIVTHSAVRLISGGWFRAVLCGVE